MPWKNVLTAGSFLFLLACSAGPTVPTMPAGTLSRLPEGAMARFTFASGGGNAEAYLVRPRGPGPFPLIVLLHGHSWIGAGARRLLPAADIFAKEVCYASLAISLPGYGETDVVPGPLADITRQVVLDAVTSAKRVSWVDSERIYVYGFSRGAVVAAALVNRIDGVKGALLHSGAYDLTKLYESSSSAWLRKLLNPDAEAQPKFYDLLSEVKDWSASTLVLHGAQDSLIPVSQALLLRDRLATFGKPHRLVLFPEHGHRLPLREIKDQVLQFLKDNGGSACPANDP